MRLYEIVRLREEASVASTVSGGIATVSAPLGGVQRRIPGDMFSAKYTTDSNLTPNTPEWMKQYKRKK
jgi:hypothetical protein